MLASCATAQNATVSCDKTLAAEMGTGGGGLMFFLGFMVAAVLALLGWFFLIRKQGPPHAVEEPRQQSIPVTIQPPTPVYQPPPQPPVYQPPPQPPVYPTPPPGPQGAKIYWPNQQPQQRCYYYSPVPNKALY